MPNRHRQLNLEAVHDDPFHDYVLEDRPSDPDLVRLDDEQVVARVPDGIELARQFGGLRLRKSRALSTTRGF